jgi:hypothetical protein
VRPCRPGGAGCFRLSLSEHEGEAQLYYLDAGTLLFLGLKWRHPGLDVVRVVDVGLGGRSDTEILEWAAREGRVVVSRYEVLLLPSSKQGELKPRPFR